MKTEAELIVEKLKKEHSLKGATSKALLDSIQDSLELLISAKDSILLESQRKRAGLKNDEFVPYGLLEDRFGELKLHPGNAIVKDAQSNIRACLKDLGIRGEKGEKEGKPKAGKEQSLTQMIASR